MRLLATAAALAVSLLIAAPAFAVTDNGEGLVGETDDKIITFYSLGLVIFFTLVVVVGTAIQNALERRKQQRKAVELRRRVGW